MSGIFLNLDFTVTEILVHQRQRFQIFLFGKTVHRIRNTIFAGKCILGNFTKILRNIGSI